MLTKLGKFKYKLSHISVEAWHYWVVKQIWGKKAQGKACTYYWIKLPTALIGLLILVVVIIFLVAVRSLIVSVAWFAGHRFNGNLIDLETDFMEGYNYMYKRRLDGRKIHIAPWEAVAVPITLAALFYFLVVNQFLGMVLLGALAALAVLAAFVFIATRGWRNPLIAQARQNVVDAWDKVCPALEITDGAE